MTPSIRIEQLLVAVGTAVLVIGSVGCSPPNHRDDSSDTSEDEWRIDAAETDDGPPDGSMDSDLSLELGRGTEQSRGFEPYADSGGEIELVHGFQGGYHVEPALYVTGIDRSEFETEIVYDVIRVSNGESLVRPTTYTIEDFGWMEWMGGHLHYSNPVIFTVSNPPDLTGEKVRLEVSVDLKGGGRIRATHEGTIVDEEGR